MYPYPIQPSWFSKGITFKSQDHQAGKPYDSWIRLVWCRQSNCRWHSKFKKSIGGNFKLIILCGKISKWTLSKQQQQQKSPLVSSRQPIQCKSCPISTHPDINKHEGIQNLIIITFMGKNPIINVERSHPWSKRHIISIPQENNFMNLKSTAIFLFGF